MHTAIRPNTEDSAHAWQKLAALPRCKLAEFPTPLLSMRRLGEAMGGLDIRFKRDDLISFGLGGNKVRGLELLLGDALACGADTLVTGAGCQSNHVRATAAAAIHRDLRCSAVFWGSRPTTCEGNYRLTRLLGAEIHFTGDSDRASVDRAIEEQCRRVRAAGHRPYPIPRGGACALGTLGHVLAVREVLGQCRAEGIAPEAVLFATGSGGTHAGWLLGSRLLGAAWSIESFTVSREVDTARTRIARLATEAAGLLGLDWHFVPDDTTVHGGVIGPGYGLPSPEGADAIRLVARTEGVLLDPTYTGKAMAGLLALQRRGQLRYRSLVFLHTGGEPAFFTGDGTWLTEQATHTPEPPPCIW